jgi:hypothetical protein
MDCQGRYNSPWRVVMLSQNIDRSIFENEVIRYLCPVLLCFFKETILHGDAMATIEALSRQYRSVRFYIVPEEELEFFFERFHFGGTPIFILLDHGREKGRLLGRVTSERLRVFLDANTGKNTGPEDPAAGACSDRGPAPGGNF